MCSRAGCRVTMGHPRVSHTWRHGKATSTRSGRIPKGGRNRCRVLPRHPRSRRCLAGDGRHIANARGRWRHLSLALTGHGRGRRVREEILGHLLLQQLRQGGEVGLRLHQLAKRNLHLERLLNLLRDLRQEQGVQTKLHERRVVVTFGKLDTGDLLEELPKLGVKKFATTRIRHRWGSLCGGWARRRYMGRAPRDIARNRWNAVGVGVIGGLRHGSPGGNAGRHRNPRSNDGLNLIKLGESRIDPAALLLERIGRECDPSPLLVEVEGIAIEHNSV